MVFKYEITAIPPSSSLGASMSSYGLNLHVLKDNIEYTQFQLL